MSLVQMSGKSFTYIIINTLPCGIGIPLWTEYHLENFELILTLYCLSLKNALIHSIIILGKPKDATLFIKRL